ncbi:unnamed protein product [Parnassius apollo]|uniref:(apollo) hypothetical protein n=1 Tax=Parnassius apollo TaxID=110799 RepID=A0A8S3XAU9_PARAO|nr:unnamed protein product [Parnassius apollo]
MTGKVYTTLCTRARARGLTSFINTRPQFERETPHHRPAHSRALSASPRTINTHLFNLEVVGAQRLLDLLFDPARRSLHRAAEPVQDAFESKLLHREPRSRRGSFVRSPAAATSQPSAADSEPVLAERARARVAVSAQPGASAATRAPRRDRRQPRHRLRNVRQCGLARDRYLPHCDTRALRTTRALPETLANWPERARYVRSMLSHVPLKEMSAHYARKFKPRLAKEITADIRSKSLLTGGAPRKTSFTQFVINCQLSVSNVSA